SVPIQTSDRPQSAESGRTAIQHRTTSEPPVSVESARPLRSPSFRAQVANHKDVAPDVRRWPAIHPDDPNRQTTDARRVAESSNTPREFADRIGPSTKVHRLDIDRKAQSERSGQRVPAPVWHRDERPAHVESITPSSAFRTGAREPSPVAMSDPFADRWPTLPDGLEDAEEQLEERLRAIRRLNHLDREQRGTRWNA